MKRKSNGNPREKGGVGLNITVVKEEKSRWKGIEEDDDDVEGEGTSDWEEEEDEGKRRKGAERRKKEKP